MAGHGGDEILRCTLSEKLGNRFGIEDGRCLIEEEDEDSEKGGAEYESGDGGIADDDDLRKVPIPEIPEKQEQIVEDEGEVPAVLGALVPIPQNAGETDQSQDEREIIQQGFHEKDLIFYPAHCRRKALFFK